MKVRGDIVAAVLALVVGFGAMFVLLSSWERYDFNGLQAQITHLTKVDNQWHSYLKGAYEYNAANWAQERADTDRLMQAVFGYHPTKQERAFARRHKTVLTSYMRTRRHLSAPDPGQLTALFAPWEADVGASATLPAGPYAGQVVWAGGDTLAYPPNHVICTPSACGYGFPHDSLSLQSAPGNLDLATVTGTSLPYGIQQIPNAANGDIYWMGGLVANDASLFVFVTEIQPGSGTFGFKVIGEDVAVFSLGLQFEHLVPIPVLSNGQIPLISAADRVSGGWWLYATDGSPKEGDVAWVPVGDMQNPSLWTWDVAAIPSSVDALGTSGGLIYSSATGKWELWTKHNDFLGSAVDELRAPSPTGPWTFDRSISLSVPIDPNTGQACAFTYAVAAHPEQPTGATYPEILISYAAGSPSGAQDYACYHIYFSVYASDK